ncbi:MAG TPA: terminase small subunit [Puia sp.]|jgi:hypothetical protein
MAAPKGNQFWKLRSEHGREKLFASPDLLWEAAQQYFNWCDGHPWYMVEAARQGARLTKTKDGQYKEPDKLLKIPTVIPYTLTGFCLYIDASKYYWGNFRKQLHKALDNNKNDKLSEDFIGIIDRIELIIETQKFTGVAVGAFKGNIISSEMGAAAKIEVRQVDKEGNDVKAPPALNIVVQRAAAPIAESEEE